ncbi:MAG: hypothetical protein P0Y56_09045 [Candidatus Andeanibacterium colombiense]|uniref:Thioredoxin n=1 Tax=Candidatus Andeanibacterium colombiense TaxID=3121345 RepID=A0AAJ5X445_9SPHN|nr:MAG: hypothetical protein P0Y56_09045 [Sphingomonadaceae bacterium]
MSDLNETGLALAWIDDAEFERLVLDRGERTRMTVVLFCRAGSPEGDQAAEVLAEAAGAADEAFMVDVAAASSQAIIRRFVIGPVPLLMLFLGGTFRAIFEQPKLTSGMVEQWIESHTPAQSA